MSAAMSAVKTQETTPSVEDLIGSGQSAIARREYNEALSFFEQALALKPDDIDLQVKVGVALRELKRFDEAETTFNNILKASPGHESASVGHAWVAHSRSDWPEAIRRWERIRKLWPKHSDGYFGGGAAVQGLGDSDASDAVYREAFRQVPASPHLLDGFARVAQQRRDWDEAERRWTTLRTLYPQNVSGYVGSASMLGELGRLDEANVVLLSADSRFPKNPQILIALAQNARRRGDLAQALERWDVVATEFPGLVDGYIGATDILTQLGRIEDAQNVLLPAIRMFPNSFDVAQRHCWIAHYRQDWGEAQKRWEDLRKRFPERPTGYLGGAATLRDCGSLDQAEELVADALARFVGDFWVLMEWARLSLARQAWEEAIELLESIRKAHPKQEQVYILLASTLVHAKRADDADAVLKQGMDLLGAAPALEFAYCATASDTKNWPEAERRWREAVARYPKLAASHTGLAAALRGGGRPDESDQVLASALRNFPGNLELELNRALNASMRRNWEVALQLWADLKRRYPLHGPIRSGIVDALWQARQDLGMAEVDGHPRAFEIPPILLERPAEVAKSSVELTRLFLGFESIGDTCEFGIVQRRFGAEPLSLLRWTSTAPDVLVTALDARMAGIGDPEHTIVAVSNGEYTTRDKRYHMFSHTFTPETAMPYDKFYNQQCRRLQYLRAKFLDDLAAAEKIFVYKSNKGLTLDQARALHAAIRRYGGRSSLLCMRLQDDTHPVGHVDVIEDGLFIGYADRFSTIDINVENWVRICRHVEVEVRRSQMDETAPTPPFDEEKPVLTPNTALTTEAA